MIKMELKLKGFLWSSFLLSLFIAAFAEAQELDSLPGAVPKTCTVQENGILLAFSGEAVKLTLPCKYHLADITCGNYRVKVTPGNGPPTTGMYSRPVSLWAKIVDLETNDYVKVRTSLKRLKRFLDGKVTPAWKTKEGNLSSLDVMGYSSEADAFILKKTGVFEVRLSASGNVIVTCEAEEFTSKPVPETLCGNGTDAVEQSSVNHLILNDKTVTQSYTCDYKALIYQTCDNKKEALTECDVILNDESRVQCLSKSNTTSLGIYYRDCLRAVCSHNATLLEPMNTFINENCKTRTDFCHGIEYKVLDDVERNVNYGAEDMCDKDLTAGWYRFLHNNTNAVMPTKCVLEGMCGGFTPLWLDLEGRELPVPGDTVDARACAVSGVTCCAKNYPVTVLNCRDYYLYKLKPTDECFEVYCTTH